MTIVSFVAQEVGVSEDELRDRLRKNRNRVKLYRVKKRSGDGQRRIAVPPRLFKVVQYYLILNYLRSVPIHRSATAFRKGASIVDNATRHREGSYFVKLDISNFFPSIYADQFFTSMERVPGQEAAFIAKQADDEELNLAMFWAGRCAIGYPVSPYVANIVMKEFDEAITQKLLDNRREYGNATYTRYADDITISIANKGFKKEITEIVESSMRHCLGDRFQINKDKTRFGSRFGGNALITGLRVCRDGRITLHRKYKDHVRLLLSLYEKRRLDDSEVPSLRGHLNYCSFADPHFFTKLVNKHLEAVKRLENGSGVTNTGEESS